MWRARFPTDPSIQSPSPSFIITRVGFLGDKERPSGPRPKGARPHTHPHTSCQHGERLATTAVPHVLDRVGVRKKKRQWRAVVVGLLQATPGRRRSSTRVWRRRHGSGAAPGAGNNSRDAIGQRLCAVAGARFLLPARPSARQGGGPEAPHPPGHGGPWPQPQHLHHHVGRVQALASGRGRVGEPGQAGAAQEPDAEWWATAPAGVGGGRGGGGAVAPRQAPRGGAAQRGHSGLLRAQQH